jgi:hypothetical protein
MMAMADDISQQTRLGKPRRGPLCPFCLVPSFMTEGYLPLTLLGCSIHTPRWPSGPCLPLQSGAHLWHPLPD